MKIACSCFDRWEGMGKTILIPMLIPEIRDRSDEQVVMVEENKGERVPPHDMRVSKRVQG